MDDRELWNLVQGYVARSPFYQQQYRNLKAAGFTDLPFISKRDLLADQAKYPPLGNNLAVSRNDISRIHRTSGTSTKPLLMALTRSDIDIVVQAGSQAFRIAGMGPGDIIFNCMNYCMWMGGFMDHLSMEATGAAVIPYGVGQTENLINLLLDLEQPSLHSTPSYLETIKSVLKDKFGKRPIDLGIKKGFFGGESGMQNPAFRAKIEEEWGMRAMNANYGLSEVLSILGSECKKRDGLHFTAGPFLYTELLYSDVSAGTIDIRPGAIGELVVTTLRKQAQPLVRYRTGDIIEIIATGPCECGKDSFRFRVVGRRDDMLVIKGINFYPESVRSIIASYPECSGNYKIFVPNRQPVTEIKLVVQAAGNSHNGKLAAAISRDIKNRLSVSPVIELVDEIKIEGNKIKLVEVV